jgi:hypothetical protein
LEELQLDFNREATIDQLVQKFTGPKKELMTSVTLSKLEEIENNPTSLEAILGLKSIRKFPNEMHNKLIDSAHFHVTDAEEKITLKDQSLVLVLRGSFIRGSDIALREDLMV